MNILIDINLSPRWTSFLTDLGVDAVHWSTIGDPKAPDTKVLEWARRRGYVVFTHDLDFGALLSITRGTGPSVVQVRTQDVTPEATGPLVIAAIREHRASLEQGAIVTIEPHASRVRVLPIRGDE